MAEGECERIAEHYRAFANAAARRSPRYRDWASGIAVDAELLDRISSLPRGKRDPQFVFACARVVGVPLRPFASARADFIELWSGITATAKARRNHRTSPSWNVGLLIALQQIKGPIALIDVSAEVGYSVIPDAFAYDLHARGRSYQVGESPVHLPTSLTGWGATPPTIPAITYREGIDPAPLNGDLDDVAWLLAREFPEGEIRGLIADSAELVLEANPLITKGAVAATIRGAVARARRAAPKATIVLWSPFVVERLPKTERVEFEKYCSRAKLHWVSLDHGDADGACALTIDGRRIATTDIDCRDVVLENMHGLTPDELDLIEFERVYWGPLRSKESLVRKHWSLSLVRYYQLLYAIMESVAARRYDPILVRAFDEAKDQPARRGR
ncbi:MAG: hypothetical protein RLZ72_417 [Actinomycetota bacterium]